MTKPLIDRVLQRTTIDEESGCWIWQGARTGSGGYGVIGASGSLLRVHRVTYEYFIGPIPDGMVLDHLCHSQSECPGGEDCSHIRCVNPDHLEVVTQSENAQRAHHKHPERYGKYQRSRTHCPKGHPYDETNTYINNGKRRCKECARQRCADYARKRRK